MKTILAQNQIRVPDLVPIRHQRMAASPWNFYRGAAAVMAGDLASQPHSGLVVQRIPVLLNHRERYSRARRLA